MHTKLHQRVYPDTELNFIILFPIFTLACVYVVSLFCSFLCFLPPQISLLSLTALSPHCLLNSSLRDRSEPNWEQSQYCQPLRVVLRADTNLQNCGRTAHVRAHSALAPTHSHGIAEIQETKMRKQLYLFSADPAAAKGAPLKSDLVFRWVNLWLLDVRFCLFIWPCFA